MPRVARMPSHAGSWYEKDGAKLEAQIDAWLAKAGSGEHEHATVSTSPKIPPRAIIAPHAGYSYCGHIMAHAYRHIDPDSVKRVFLLGPSHYLGTRKCVLSSATEYVTPLGSLHIDQPVYDELRATGAFEVMELEPDETEHSMELHTPYIARIMGPRPFTLVPIMIGALTQDSEARYAALLSRYLADRDNLFIISSDFCHWGSRFRYTWTRGTGDPVWQDVTWLDRQAMDAIEAADPAAFARHLSDTRNTICGRHPIGVLLQMLALSPAGAFKVAFTAYDQSSRAARPTDSSVSYAAALVTPTAGV